MQIEFAATTGFSRAASSANDNHITTPFDVRVPLSNAEIRITFDVMPKQPTTSATKCAKPEGELNAYDVL